MNSRLTAFLRADDLDDALSAFRNLGKLSEDELACIHQVLADWSPPQAVANILIHALIPGEQQLDYLLKGLHETKIPYFVLAATVGLQELSVDSIAESQRQLIVDKLFNVMEQHPTFAGRATLSIWPFLTLNDAPRMFRLLGLLDETGRHNALAWLVKELANKEPEAFSRFAIESGVSAEVAQFVQEKLNEYNEAKANGTFTSIDFPLLSYIPNLKDM